MVTLIVNDYNQVNIVEDALIRSNIAYEVKKDTELNGNWGIAPPFLMVHGVPLDTFRSLKWVRGMSA